MAQCQQMHPDQEQSSENELSSTDIVVSSNESCIEKKTGRLYIHKNQLSVMDQSVTILFGYSWSSWFPASRRFILTYV